MPRRPNFVRRIAHWVRNQVSAQEEEGQTLRDEQGQQRRAAEAVWRQRQRIISYNQWIVRQRHIAHNQRLQTESRDDPSNPGGEPTVYRFSLLEVPEEVQRVTRGLVLIIAENGVIFRLDLVQEYDGRITWAVTASWPIQ